MSKKARRRGVRGVRVASALLVAACTTLGCAFFIPKKPVPPVECEPLGVEAARELVLLPTGSKLKGWVTYTWLEVCIPNKKTKARLGYEVQP